MWLNAAESCGETCPCRRSRALDRHRGGIVQYLGRQETRQEKGEKLFRSRQCIITARHLAQLAFGPKADAPTSIQSSMLAPTGT